MSHESHNHGPVTDVNLYTTGDKLLKPSGDRYTGYYHIHLDGTYMVGKDHIPDQPMYELLLNPDWVAANEPWNSNPIDEDKLDIPKTPDGNKLILEEIEIKSDAYKPITHQTIKRKWNNKDYNAVINTTITELIRIKSIPPIDIIQQPDQNYTDGALTCAIGYWPTLVCIGRSNKKLNLSYKWLKDGVERDTSQGSVTGLTDGGSQLKLEKITPKEIGFWSCEISDSNDDIIISNGVYIDVINPNDLEIFGSNVLKNSDAKQDLTYWQVVGADKPVPLALDRDYGNYYLKNGATWATPGHNEQGAITSGNVNQWPYTAIKNQSVFDVKRRDEFGNWTNNLEITPQEKGFRVDKNSRYFFGGWGEVAGKDNWGVYAQNLYSTMRQEIDFSEASEIIDSQHMNGNGKIKGIISCEADLWGWLGSMGWTEHISLNTSRHAGDGSEFNTTTGYSEYACEWTTGGGFTGAIPSTGFPLGTAGKNNNQDGWWDGRHTFMTSWLRTQVHDKVYVTIDFFDKNESLLNKSAYQIENHMYYKDLPHSLWYLYWTGWQSRKPGENGTRWRNVLDWDRTSITDYDAIGYPNQIWSYMPGEGLLTMDNGGEFWGRVYVPETPVPPGVSDPSGQEALDQQLAQALANKLSTNATIMTYISGISAIIDHPLVKVFISSSKRNCFKTNLVALKIDDALACIAGNSLTYLIQKITQFSPAIDDLRAKIDGYNTIVSLIADLKDQGAGVTPPVNYWSISHILNENLGAMGTPTVGGWGPYTNTKQAIQNRGQNIAGFMGLPFKDIYKKTKFFYSEKTRIKIPKLTRKAVVTVKWVRDPKRGFTYSRLGAKYNPNSMKNTPPGPADNPNSMATYGLEYLCGATNMGVQLNVLGQGKPYSGAEELQGVNGSTIYNLTPDHTAYDVEGTGEWGGIILENDFKSNTWEIGDPWWENPDHPLVIIDGYNSDGTPIFSLLEPGGEYDPESGELLEGGSDSSDSYQDEDLGESPSDSMPSDDDEGFGGP